MLHNMKGQFAEHLMHTGFVCTKDPKDTKSNVNSGKYDLGFVYQETFIPMNIIIRLWKMIK